MFKATIHGLLAHKLRLGLTAFSIVLGIAFVCATLTFSNALQTSFDNIFQSQSTQVAVVVQGHAEQGGRNGGFGTAHRPIPASLLSTVRAVSGVTAAEGVIFRSGATLLNPDGKPYTVGGGPPGFGTNWLDNQSLSPYRLRAGSPPNSGNQVVLDAGTADKHGITVGQTVEYVINGGAKQSFVVSGIAKYGTSNSVGGATISLFRLDVVQNGWNLKGKYDQIQAAGQSNLSQTELRDRISSQLPSYAEAETEASYQGQQLQGIDSFFSIFRTILLVFALIALFVGSYIIINTFNILIAQRTRELALLRILGATRGQVFRLVLIEAVFTGLFGSVIGVLASVPLAKGLYSLVSSLGSSGLPKADLVLQGSTIAIGIGLGTVITVVASILPARKASRVAPVAALRESEDYAQPLGARRIGGGLLVSVGGAVLIGLGLFAGTSDAFQLLGAGAFLLYIGVSSLAPLSVVPVAGTLGIPIQKVRGTPGKLARINSIRAPRRAASTAAALMIGVSLVVGIAVLTQSIKDSTTIAIKDSLVADYLVFAGGGGGDGGVNPNTVKTLAADPHFSTVDDLKFGTILVKGSSTSVVALDPANYKQLFRLDVASGSDASLSQPNTIFIDAQTAADNRWKAGDIIKVNFPQSGDTLSMTIGCIYNANALINGYLISTQTYAKEFPEPESFGIILKAAPGVDHFAGLAALNRDLSRFPTLKGYDTAAFIALQSAELDSFTAAIDVFLAMAILIASLGIINTLALSIIERTRELGLLRAIGLTRRQTRTMIRWESVLIAFLGLVLGAVLGVALGAAVVKALAFTGIGHISIPWGSLVIYAIATFVVGLLAAILPARRAARLNVLEAIYSE